MIAQSLVFAQSAKSTQPKEAEPSLSAQVLPGRAAAGEMANSGWRRGNFGKVCPSGRHCWIFRS
jgi:hypothetical protein